MLENDEELFERGFQEFAKLFSLIGCSRLFQAMMMMMENYEELYERCFQVTYFTPVKCGIFKTTELIELSLSKANNIFLFFFISENIKGQRTNQTENAVIGKSRLPLILRVSSVPKDWVGTLTFANVSRYLAQGGRGAAKENICAKVKNISLNDIKWYFDVTSIPYQTAP